MGRVRTIHAARLQRTTKQINKEEQNQQATVNGSSGMAVNRCGRIYAFQPNRSAPPAG